MSSVLAINLGELIMSNNNPLTEISLLVLSVALLAAMTVLLVFGKITYVEALNFLIILAGLFGVNVAAKAPSPSQQAQISTQQESLQSLVSLIATHTHPLPPTPTPTQLGVPTNTVRAGPVPQVQFGPDPAVSMAASQTGMMPAVTPPVQP